jgi:serpin B
VPGILRGDQGFFGGKDATPPPGFEALLKELLANAEPPPAEEQEPVEVTPDDLAQLVSGNNTFAFDLYQVLNGQDGNLFYSPYSISLALAMTYSGARGETEEEIREALKLLLPQERLHPTFQALAEELAKRGEGAQGSDGEGFRLNIVNALWGQEGYPFLVPFLDVLDAHYGAGLRQVDYINASEKARVTINDWVSEQTEDRIQDLIPSGVLSALTRLVLTNAIYFNAAWAEPFDADLTQDEPFYLLDGSEISVPMMRDSSFLGYVARDGFQAVEIPYDGWEMSMVILLPDSGQFESFEKTLTAGKLADILEGVSSQQIALGLPRFEFESTFSLRQALSALGMPVAFSAEADFSGMTGNRELSVSEVLHKAFVSVDEAGTEAAAATAVVMDLTSMPQEPIQVTVDHPFLFLIRDLETGTILFVGRVIDPSS